jgi:hypothetical protein
MSLPAARLTPKHLARSVFSQQKGRHVNDDRRN